MHGSDNGKWLIPIVAVVVAVDVQLGIVESR